LGLLREHVPLQHLTDVVFGMHEAVAPQERDHVAFSDGAKRAMELALREALTHGLEKIDASAVLLGILRETGDGVAVLTQAGVDVEALRQEVVDGLHRDEEPVTLSRSMSTTATAQAVPAHEEDPQVRRPWLSPRCHGCRELIADNAQVRTLPVHDRVTGAEHHFLFLYCGNCGTAFAVERVNEPPPQ
jgi:hypothetical protein